MKTEIKMLPEFEKAVLELGFTEFTEIQEKCIPLIQQGKDVIGLSYTGSGKTAAFGFPALEKVVPGKGIQLLVLVPTRELCQQVANEFRKFTKYRRTHIVEVYGGVSINPQIDHLRRADVVVGTTGRVMDHLGRGTFNTSKIKILVLDEADKMLEMGFIEDVEQIMTVIPVNCQKLFFGATMPQEIMDIVHRYMNNPEKVKMQTYVDRSKLVQHYYETNRKLKFSLLVDVINKESKGLTIVFCATRQIVDLINRSLKKHGIQSEALHGGITQNKRKQIMDEFSAGKVDVLVASDVAARGLDVKNVNLVINYDLPKTSHEYVHRIGRTARAGSTGKVVSLLTPEDHDNFRRVLEDRSLLVQPLEVPRVEYKELSRMERPMGGRGFSGRREGSGGPPRRGFRRGGYGRGSGRR